MPTVFGYVKPDRTEVHEVEVSAKGDFVNKRENM